MPSTSRIQIKAKALENNIDFIRSLIGNQTILSAVIKGNAYGHGTHIIIPAFEKYGVNHFSVYSSAEARDAFKYKLKETTLLIMGYILPSDYFWAIDNDVEFFVSDISVLNNTIEIAKQLEKKAIIHLDLETGMNRTGLGIAQLKKAVPIIKKNEEHLIIRGVTSHFAGAESIANHLRVKTQFSVFKKRVKYINSQGIYPEIKHIASSAATINYPDSRLDMVRVGILIYGYWPTQETFIHYIHRRKDKSDPLLRAIRWCTNVISIKKVPAGEFIGYGLSFQAQYDMITILVPVGYCNGYSRSLSNSGHIIVKNHIAPIIGSVNMNMLIADVTNIENIQIGDKVVLIGKQGDNEISFSSFAEMNNSLNYEILARLPQNIERIETDID